MDEHAVEEREGVGFAGSCEGRVEPDLVAVATIAAETPEAVDAVVDEAGYYAGTAMARPEEKAGSLGGIELVALEDELG